MPLFHLDWFVCQDGYRLEERRASRRVRRSGENRLVIVPNSEAWLPSKPLNSPGLYRHLCGCDLGGPEELLGFIQTYGLLFRAKGPKEPLADVVEYALSMRHLVTAIDGCDWRSIAEGLRRPGEGKLFPTRGIGRLAVLFEVSDDGRASPSLKLRPANLADGLHVQALSDASLGPGMLC
jgi:hypothetical protein